MPDTTKAPPPPDFAEAIKKRRDYTGDDTKPSRTVDQQKFHDSMKRDQARAPLDTADLASKLVNNPKGQALLREQMKEKK